MRSCYHNNSTTLGRSSSDRAWSGAGVRQPIRHVTPALSPAPDVTTKTLGWTLPDDLGSDADITAVGSMVSDSANRVTIPKLPLITSQGSANDCGPHALAMAASALLTSSVAPDDCAELLRPYRVPGLGATMPWGIPLVAKQLGLRTRSGILGATSDLVTAIDAGRPVVVLVHPYDFAARWYDLHYRVVVGYERDATGLVVRWLLACSATPVPPAGEPGWNLAQGADVFAAQWHTYLVPRWYAVLSAG
jgi:hypothetical protein